MAQRSNGKGKPGEARPATRVIGRRTSQISAAIAALPPLPTRMGTPLDETLVFRSAAKVKPHPMLRELINRVLQKTYVLDTNVLIHDPSSLFRFEDNDVFLPMMTLEELDAHKKGTTDVARNARQVSRSLDALVKACQTPIENGIPLNGAGNTEATGRLYLQTTVLVSDLDPTLPSGKADNQILSVVKGLQKNKGEHAIVILVSKDINMRVKARVLGLRSEDYRSDKVLEDKDILYPGTARLPEDFWKRHGQGLQSWKQGRATRYRVRGPLIPTLVINQFVHLEGVKSFHARVMEYDGKSAVLETVRNYGKEKNKVFGINARNQEQTFALNLLLDPDIHLVTLVGQAGSGKTLLTLAAGLHQVTELRRYSNIIITRVTIPVGEDIGFLPGTEEEKMEPWMGALHDNLEVLVAGGATKHDGAESDDWHRQTMDEQLLRYIQVKSLNYMRGRTLLNKYLIIDECQNLTPKQMKTLITRAGPGTKVVCLGNLAQIDTPYLTEGASGLTFVVERMRGWPNYGHVLLPRGARSRLADYAAEVL